MKQGVFVFLVFIVYLFSLIGGTGCANIVPPSGGPRDSLPPVMVSAEPADSTTNFKGEVIRLHFDEYIDLQNVPQNLLFTPLMEKIPEVNVKLKTITIKLKEPLEENTTYTFNFGNAIRDYTEGNIIKDFTYTFSTGPALDSLELRGSVVMAETGKTDTTLQVLLHRNLADTAVQKELPRYAAKLDGRGNFYFKNLAPGTYAIYALGDAGIARRYLDPKRQTFAFADAPVQVGDSSQNIVLYAYKEASTTPAPTPAPAAPPRAPRGTTPNDRRLRFGTSLVNGNQQELTKDLVVTFDVPYRFL
ncbi:MAG TPA: Ig-like domain-containing protein, partial [Chitinophagaceae bacterium]